MHWRLNAKGLLGVLPLTVTLMWLAANACSVRTRLRTASGPVLVVPPSFTSVSSLLIKACSVMALLTKLLVKPIVPTLCGQSLAHKRRTT
jgi:hypothetical protein